MSARAIREHKPHSRTEKQKHAHIGQEMARSEWIRVGQVVSQASMKLRYSEANNRNVTLFTIGEKDAYVAGAWAPQY